MELALLTFWQMVIMMLLILVGVFCVKQKMLDDRISKKLTDILLQIVNPVIIIVSYQTDFSMEKLKGLGMAFILSIIGHALFIVAGLVLIKKKNNPKCNVERYSFIFTNSVFIGVPLLKGILGIESVFYLTAYVTVSYAIMWTYGVMLMKGSSSKKDLLQLLNAPSLWAIVLGLMLYICQIRIPEVPLTALNMLADMNTPLAMLLAGAAIAQTNLIKAFTKWRTYYITFIIMLVLPLIFIVLMLPFGAADSLVKITILVLVACPAATHSVLMALKYDQDYIYATEIFTMTTVVSIATMPLIIMLAKLVM